ncbi:MAG TPA: ATP-binding protein [Vicinamibacterales bacterium]|nr:ATP-binding protein [Vicinamibacterales bacterium]
MSQPLDFLAGGGSTGALMRAHDWSESPLGPPDTWPQSLRIVVELLLQSQFPMFVAWGKELGFLYNDPYAEILGAKHPRALGRRFYDIWSEIWSDISPLIDAAMAGHASYREDLPLVMNRRGYDEQTWFTFSYSPVRDESGAVAGMFCACSETTRRVLAEQALRQNEAQLLELNETLERRVTDAIAERLHDQERLRHAEAALRQTQKMESLGQLTGGVAHDFNNLLAVFATGLQLLERNVGGEQRQRIFDGMRRAVARGTGLTRHLLAFSRQRPINPESIDVATHLRTLREMLNGSLGGDIQVEMKFDADVWPVEIDAGELELAILNLCLNARDAMAEGGAVTITAENVHVDGEHGSQTEYVKLCVTDTGCGMPPPVLARAFEPFFTTKDVGKGSGLGLPQVYGFAHQSGGQVTIDSEVGVGTIVTLLLPRSIQALAAGDQVVDSSGAAPVRPNGSRRGHVLLVEDDKEVSALIREMLSTLGFTVTHVTSAEAALGALANARAIDWVLSDIMMPGGVSGLELAREIRNRFPDMPVILTTGYVEAAARMEEGEFPLLPKPYSLEALAEALGVEVL